MENNELNQVVLNETNELNNLINEKNILEIKYNNLLNDYNNIQQEYDHLLDSFSYRIGLKTWETAYKLHLVDLYRKIKSRKGSEISQNMESDVQDESTLQQENENTQTAEKIENEAITCCDIDEEENRARNHWEYYRSLYGQLTKEQNPVTENIRKLIFKNYKGIIVYPQCVHWEPCQRPQHLLRGFAKDGYLCFFCEVRSDTESLRKIDDNLYIVYGEEYLVPVLLDKAPIILISYFLQYNFASYIKHSVIWFDILDRPDFFDLGKTQYANNVIKNILNQADIITYSGEFLNQFIDGRNDAIYLPNAVFPDDFKIKKQAVSSSNQELENIKKHNKKIVGYFGAIEHWFDADSIKAIIEKTDYEIVLIGNLNREDEVFKNNRVHAIGSIPYQELPSYASYFDIAIIPFIVNDLTNCVSPVKFFEYLALGIPVVSSAIHEMLRYENKGVLIYRDINEIPRKLHDAMSLKNKYFINEILDQNTWEKRVSTVQNQLYNTIGGLRSLAEIQISSGISLFSVSFFDYDGVNYFSGGAERYLIDLDQVCKELNVRFRVYQYGRFDWVRFYDHLEVIGLGAEKNNVDEYTEYLMHEMSEKYQINISGNDVLSIYSPFYLLDCSSKVDSIGISHGISWDNEASNYTDGDTFWWRNKRIIDSVNYCDTVISVDTNTCNWFQTVNFEKAQQMKFVPNYVDSKVFSYQASKHKPGKIVITYPRRLYRARGLYMVLDVMDYILEKYPNTEFHFVGKGFEEDTKYVQDKIEKWEDRVFWYSKAPEKMNEVYAYTDIALVPTVYSEGTSLSCLEAMSSGNAVIATRIGGLTNLIINGFNGIMIEPDADSLKSAICELIDNPEKRRRITENAIETANYFSKESWKEKWKAIIKQRLKEDCSPYRICIRCRINIKNNQDMLKPEILSLIKKHLQSGEYVFVSISHNEYRNMSYGRLQFIDSDEELYFVPEILIEA